MAALKFLAVVLLIDAAYGNIGSFFPRITFPKIVTAPPDLSKFTLPTNLPKLPTNFPISASPTLNCDKDAPKSMLILCCQQKHQTSCSDAIKKLAPTDLPSLGCADAKKVLQSATASDLERLKSAVGKKSSPCLSQALAQSYTKILGNPGTWSKSSFQKIPIPSLSQLDLSSLKSLNSTIFHDKDSLKRLGDAMPSMTPGQARGVFQGLSKAYGDVKTWSKDTFNTILKNAPQTICTMSPSDIKNLKGDSVEDQFKDVSKAVKTCGNDAKRKVNFGNGFLSLFKRVNGEPKDWNVSTFKRVANFKGVLQVKSIFELSKDVLEDDDTVEKDDDAFAPNKKRAIVAALKKKFDVSNALDQLSDMLDKVPALLSSLDDTDLSDLNCSIIAKHFLASAYTRIPTFAKLRLYQRVKWCGFSQLNATDTDQTAPTSDDIRQFTAEQFKTLSSYFAIFSSNDIEKFSSGAAQDAFKNMKAAEKLQKLSRNQGRGLLRALDVIGSTAFNKSAAGTVSKLGKLVKFFTPGDAYFLSLDDIMNITEGLDFSDRPDLSKSFAKKALKSLGKNFSDTSKWPSNSKFGELGAKVVTGFNRTTWKSLPDSGYFGFVSQAAKFKGFNQGQAKQMIKRMGVDFAKTASEDQIRDLRDLVCQFNESVLGAIPDAIRLQVGRNLGQAERIQGLCGNDSRPMALLNYVMQALRKASPNNRVNATEVRMLGNLGEYLSSSDLDGMTKDDLESTTYQLTHSGEGGSGKDMRMKKVADAVYKKSSDASDGSLPDDVVLNLGKAACKLPQKYFDSLASKTKFSSQIDSLGQQMCDPKGDASKNLVRQAKMQWGDVSMWDETHVRRLNNSMAAMNISDLAKLNPRVVRNALETLGKTNISLEKAKILADKLPGGKNSRVTRSTSQEQLSASEVSNLGRIACAMEPSRYSDHLNDSDVLCSLSMQNCYNNSQKMMVVNYLKNVMSFGQPNSWKEQPTSCLGSFANGLLPSDISGLSREAIMNSARHLGKQDFSDPEQRKQLFMRLKNAYGSDVMSWSESDISNMGNLAGHIGAGGSDADCRTDVGSLTSDQISAIPAESVPYLYNLKCFSSDQLRSFDGEQARAVTQTQTEQLDSAQQQSLAQVTCDPDCPQQQQGSSAGTLFVSLTSVLALGLVALIL